LSQGLDQHLGVRLTTYLGRLLAEEKSKHQQIDPDRHVGSLRKRAIFRKVEIVGVHLSISALRSERQNHESTKGRKREMEAACIDTGSASTFRLNSCFRTFVFS
jgi:hypothetical protein